MVFRRKGLFMPKSKQNGSIAQGEFWQTFFFAVCPASRTSKGREDMKIRILC